LKYRRKSPKVMIVKEMALMKKRMLMLMLMINLKKRRSKQKELIKMKMMTVMTIWMIL
tara:strand:+ start:249 stop:422 length:174 start_codon:yes stop_codon:yes gene_type:complete